MEPDEMLSTATENRHKQDELDAVAWAAWTDMQRRAPGTYTERDRQMFFVGFGYGRVHVLGTVEHEGCPAGS